MQVCASALREGKVFLIFPEGERTIDGDLGEFRKGAAILSSHTGVPILPIAICGAFEIWPRGKGLQRLNRVKLKFGRSIPAMIIPEKLTPAESDALYRRQTRLLAKEVFSLIKE
jgi:1-acyl-sn-glycerol-3-phosphate acyltransferase